MVIGIVTSLKREVNRMQESPTWVQSSEWLRLAEVIQYF